MKALLFLLGALLLISCNKKNSDTKTLTKDEILTYQLDSIKKNLPEEKKKIYSLFKIDVLKIPDSSFIRIEETEKGITYRKVLDYKELNLFKVIKIVVHKETQYGKNVIFLSDTNKDEWANILNMSDQIYSIMGMDDDKKVPLSYVEKNKYDMGRLNILRTWEKIQWAVGYSISPQDIKLTIWNVENID